MMVQLRIRWDWLLLLLAIAAALLPYANAFGQELIWDDQSLPQYAVLRDPLQWVRLFGRDMWAFAQGLGHDLYQPLTSLSYLLDVRLWGDRIAYYHLTNLLLHLLSTLLVYAIGLRVLSNRPAAGLAALFFGVHPIHTEAVAWINGRADLLSTCFALLSFWLYLLYRRKENLGLLLGSLLTFLLALLSREAAIILPAVVALYVLCFDQAPWRVRASALAGSSATDQSERVGWGGTRLAKTVVETLPFLAVAVLYLTIRFIVLGAIFARPEGSAAGLWLSAQAVALYLRLLVLPYPLNAVRQVSDLQAVSGAGVWLAPIALGFIFLLGLISLRRSRVAGFATLFFFATVLPVSWLLPAGQYVAERFLYLPSVAICFLAGAFLAWLWTRQRTAALSLILLIALPWAVLTYARSGVWSDRLTFWSQAVEASPRSATAHNYLGLEYLSQGQTAQAVAELNESVALDPQYDAAYNSLGTAYFVQGQLDQAAATFEKAATLAPNLALPQYNLGVVYDAQGRPEEALAAYQKAVELDPGYASAHLNRARLLSRLERWGEAEISYQSLLALDPSSITARRGLSYVLFREGRSEEAISELEEALRLDPQSVEALNDLGLLYQSLGQSDQAIALFEQAAGVAPEFVPTRLNLAFAYHEVGQDQKALQELDAVLNLDPDNADAQQLMQDWETP